MREIKFRIWNKEFKKFIDSRQGKAHIGLDLNGNVYNLQDGEGGKERYELQQFTGLKDKNGKEIYEGDILRRKVYEDAEYSTGFVDWRYGGFCLQEIKMAQLQINDDYKYQDEFYMQDGINFSWEFCEVIGNLYENPELLEK